MFGISISAQSKELIDILALSRNAVTQAGSRVVFPIPQWRYFNWEFI